MHPDLIQHHAERRLAHLRRSRAAAADSSLDRVRRAIARALRSQALRLEAGLPAGTPSTR